MSASSGRARLQHLQRRLGLCSERRHAPDVLGRCEEAAPALRGTMGLEGTWMAEHAEQTAGEDFRVGRRGEGEELLDQVADEGKVLPRGKGDMREIVSYRWRTRERSCHVAREI